MKKGTLKRARYFLFFILPLLGFGGGIAHAQTPEYATFTGSDSNGRGNFTCNEMPSFNYIISGQVASGDTNIPGSTQIVDNVVGGMESIYGEADAQQNIEVEVAGYGAGNDDGIGDPITNSVFTTLQFDAATPPNSLAFMIVDVEQDQVTISAIDANNNPVPNSVIDGWFQLAFDACNGCPDENANEGVSTPPTWDGANATLVGEFGNGVLATNYVGDLSDNEAGAAWFQVDIPIKEIQFRSQALGVAPDDPSQHFFIASLCTECPSPNCADIIIKN